VTDDYYYDYEPSQSEFEALDEAEQWHARETVHAWVDHYYSATGN
jgi:hypothetical protein